MRNFSVIAWFTLVIFFFFISSSCCFVLLNKLMIPTFADEITARRHLNCILSKPYNVWRLWQHKIEFFWVKYYPLYTSVECLHTCYTTFRLLATKRDGIITTLVLCLCYSATVEAHYTFKMMSRLINFDGLFDLTGFYGIINAAMGGGAQQNDLYSAAKCMCDRDIQLWWW